MLADQDDVWTPRKLEALRQRLSSADGPLLVFSDATVVDENLHPLSRSLFRRVGFSSRERQAFSAKSATRVLLRHNVATGATMAFRWELTDVALPIPAGWVHDAWLALVASLVGRVEVIEESLVLYRQHGTNVIGALEGRVEKLQTPRDRLVQLLQGSLAGWERAISIASRSDPDSQAAIEGKHAHITARLSLPSSRARRVPSIIRELASGRYHSYGRGIKTAVRDLAVS